MKESKLPQTDTTPKSTHHSFRNMMLLVLFAVLIWSWFHYLPQQAINTLYILNDRAWTQIDTRMGIEPHESVDYSLMLPAQVVDSASTGENIAEGETSTGTSQTNTGSNIVTIGRSANSQTGTTSGDTTTGTSIWDEVDAPTSTTTSEPSTGTILAPTSPHSSIMSISIGGQTITVDGTPDEDIIINGNGYTITVQQN